MLRKEFSRTVADLLRSPPQTRKSSNQPFMKQQNYIMLLQTSLKPKSTKETSTPFQNKLLRWNHRQPFWMKATTKPTNDQIVWMDGRIHVWFTNEAKSKDLDSFSFLWLHWEKFIAAARLFATPLELSKLHYDLFQWSKNSSHQPREHQPNAQHKIPVHNIDG